MLNYQRVQCTAPAAMMWPASAADLYRMLTETRVILADFYLGDLGIPFGHQNLRTIAIHRYPSLSMHFLKKKHTHI